MPASDDQLKALDLAVTQLNREYGKGTVMSLDADPEPWPSYSTGALTLDVALGIGGLPKGRIIEIYGPESSGKCLVGNTEIWTNRGLESIEEIFENHGEKPSSRKDAFDVIDMPSYVYDNEGKERNLRYLIRSGIRHCFAVKFASGRVITATGNHRFMGSSGKWISIDEMDNTEVEIPLGFASQLGLNHSDITEEQAALVAVAFERLDEIPKEIRTASPSARLAFLRALFSRSWVSVPNEKVGQQLITLLNSVGVDPILYSSGVIDTRSKLPYKVTDIVLSKTKDTVVDVFHVGRKVVYDLEVDKPNMFIANGITTHNSTLCLNTIANVQRQGGKALFIDSEHAVDPTYAKALGVKFDDLLFSQPDSAEQALNILEKVMLTGAVDIVVLDSVASMAPKAEIEGTMEDQQMGLLPRLMSKHLRKITQPVGKTETTVVFTNQIREKIGVMFGNPETTPGGRALPFHASVRISLRRREFLKDKGTGEFEGMRVRAKIVKNKMAPPFREAEFNIVYGKGIDQARAVLDLAEDLNLLEKAGAWYSYEGQQLGQGAQNSADYLKQNVELMEEIATKVFKETKV